jgi:hypothetical protein
MVTFSLIGLSFGQASFTCGTRMTPFQRIHVMGTKGQDRGEDPNVERASGSILCDVVDDGSDLFGAVGK